jgi:branched-chain amino acid transport system substrate-binding protein
MSHAQFNDRLGREIADYGVNTLGKKKWAIIHSTDAFGTNGVKNLVESAKAG